MYSMTEQVCLKPSSTVFSDKGCGDKCTIATNLQGKRCSDLKLKGCPNKYTCANPLSTSSPKLCVLL